MTLTVVKLGGSAAFAPTLRDWLAMLAGCAGHVVIVPGGGPFSEAVRQAQGDMGFCDRAAHRMAILGMEQYAHALHSLMPQLKAVRSVNDIIDSAGSGAAFLWFPAHLLVDEQALAHSWAVTSDSIAVWLAARCNAGRVILIKQVEAGVEADVHKLSRHGLVDEALPGMVAQWAGELLIAGPGGLPDVRQAIETGRAGGLLRVASRRGAA